MIQSGRITCDICENCSKFCVKKGVKIKASKTRLAEKKVVFLGYFQISGDGTEVDPSKTAKILVTCSPKLQGIVRRCGKFWDFWDIIVSFVKNFAKVARPITNLTKLDVPLWSGLMPVQVHCKPSRMELLGDPILHFPDLNGEYQIETDASSQGFPGAVLSQLVDGQMRPISFASKTTDEYEMKYGPTELEAAAIQWAVQVSALPSMVENVKF